jgi:FAD/FMN-containing dehydrogenase
MTTRVPCTLFTVTDCADILQAFAIAQAHGLSICPHGAGHSYADAALNTHGAVVDLSGMRRILAWDPERGIMQVEPGVPLRDVARVALPDGWWLSVAPSTAEATVGGCVAMNVTGRNAWKCGSFGEHVCSLDLLLATGKLLTVTPESHPDLFYAIVGSAGLLGIITAITLQLRRVTSGYVDALVRPAASLADVFMIFEQEQSADYLEALVDGFAGDTHRGRAIVTATTHRDIPERASLHLPVSRLPERVTIGLSRSAGTLVRPSVSGGKRLMDRARYHWTVWWGAGSTRRKSLFYSTFFPLEAFALYQAALPHGMLSLHAFVPRAHAEDVFKEIVRRSQAHRCPPLWAVIHQHRSDPFLLSYQVDGFSLETYYRLVPEMAPSLRYMLRELMALVVASGGRFYLAKDALLTPELYRQSMGDAPVEALLGLKRQYDPAALLQSDLFRRVFQPSNDERDATGATAGGV